MNLRDELQAIYDQHGKLTPRLVVEAARPIEHPLHARVFDRGEAEAAEAYYLDRAHRLIQKVRVTKKDVDGDEGTVGLRKFHAVKGNDADTIVYEDVDKIATDPFLFKLLTREMESAIAQAQRKQEQFLDYVSRIAGEEDRDAA